VYSLASIFSYHPNLVSNCSGKKNKIVVFIPGYKEDRIIIDTATQALKQSYPKECYEVIVLADSFSDETLAGLGQLDVTTLVVSFENSTKAKSLNKGLQMASESAPDIAVILDSDNIMAHDFLEKVNEGYNAGYKVIQGHRTAKNQQTDFALLDAINEEIGNSIFRKGHRVLGVSSALIGSAMAFDFQYFRTIMNDIEDVAGEDKLVELKILKEKQLIEYFEDALVYDEKVSNATNFSKQRTRWVGVQVYFFKHYFLDGLKELFKGNFGYFDKVFQFFLIPKVLLIGLLTLLGFFSAISLISQWWLAMAIAYILALLMAIPRSFYNLRLLRAVANIPKAILFMILGILRIRKTTASKFEVTEKGTP
jgi:cellulose synthase/poly-beta-1,6-N-acetylglucosamine synthase-like glycosyltransferase